jgi:hypothetical protein
MDDETRDYNDLMEQARNDREMADNDDGHGRRKLLGVALDLEAEARSLKRQSEQPGPTLQ